MYLFFDTETTGIPRRRSAPVTELDNWPRVVQLAFLRTDAEGHAAARGACIIKPAGFVIPPEAARVHGITTERALAEGVALQTALAEFQAAAAEAAVLVAHNMDFDGNILGAEFLRGAAERAGGEEETHLHDGTGDQLLRHSRALRLQVADAGAVAPEAVQRGFSGGALGAGRHGGVCEVFL